MARKYDIVLFGASGYTGQFVVKELATFHSEIKWCVAGRNIEKLNGVLKEIGNDISKNLDNIDILCASTDDESTVSKMCESATIVLNCVGPYRFYGETVVEQCLKNGTHHIDISGEPQFLETMQMKYFEEAKSKGIYIIGACGFDSLPCDFGCEVVRKQFPGELHSIETYIVGEINAGTTINFATWQSAIHGIAHSQDLMPVRRSLKEKVFSKKMPKPEYSLEKRSLFFKSEVVKGWCTPFIGSDRSVVQRTQMHNYQFKNERPAQVNCYLKFNSFLSGIKALFIGTIFMLMTKFSMGCYMLERFPELFSLGLVTKSPPSKKAIVNNRFSIVFKAKGWSEKLSDPTDRHTSPPDVTASYAINGPEPGYSTTAICLVNSALVLLQEKDKLPLSGGVFTPGAAFIETSLAKKLESRGIIIRKSE